MTSLLSSIDVDEKDKSHKNDDSKREYMRQYMRQYRKKHKLKLKEKQKIYSSTYQQNHKEKLSEYNCRYYEKNRDAIILKAKTWNQQNRKRTSDSKEVKENT
jgi:hypothetical protein